MLSALLAITMSTLALTASDQAAPSTCTTAQECRLLALEALEQQDYETFHTLAWRTLQAGTRNEADLMYLLARAQSLSGRPDDALVMLRRLAELGVAYLEAETSDEFQRVRGLPAWPGVLERIRAAAGIPRAMEAVAQASKGSPIERTPAPPPPSPPAPPANTPKNAPASPKPSNDGMVVPDSLVAPVAMAYDAVSRRFVFADDSSDSLKVVDELASQIVDLVRRRWADPYRTTSLAIDPRRGDLWVVGASENGAGSQSALHRLQLVSGRLLYTIPLPPENGDARFTDVAISNGGVLVLDATGHRILEIGSGGKTLRVKMKFKAAIESTGLAPAGDDVVYLAHSAGIERLHLPSNSSRPLRGARNVDLRGLEWMAAFGKVLIGIHKAPDGTREVVRITLDRAGTTATSIRVLDRTTSRAACVANGVLYYLASDESGGTILRHLDLR